MGFGVLFFGVCLGGLVGVALVVAGSSRLGVGWVVCCVLVFGGGGVFCGCGGVVGGGFWLLLCGGLWGWCCWCWGWGC
ncbi:hypothetical protein, partial [Pseudomonas syringae group genomosp. 7]|uniref:hypothetical protein n=1 Tax=Pseudomonas syringae group genomosp. 7 TaxID=251699 RepID=UPI00377057A7